mgnify:CR=1 FL=1
MNLLRNQPKKDGSTLGFMIGKPDAELENIDKISIVNVFEDYCNVFPAIKDDGYFIIAGRKGSGKSAIARYLKGSANQENDKFVSIIKTDDVKLERLIQAVPEADHSAIFEWLILTRLVKLIIDSNYTSYPRPIQALKKFYERNTRLINPGDYNLEEIINNQEVIFEVLRQEFGKIVGKKYKNTKLNKGIFYQFVPVLREVIQTVLKYEVFEKSVFYICFDDIDVKFKIQRDRGILADLIRTACKYNSEYLSPHQAKILLFVRDDLTRHLSGVDSDITKILDSSQIALNWYQHYDYQRDEKSINLRKLINKRLTQNFQYFNRKFDLTDPWRTFVEHFEDYGNKSAFSYILDFTYHTPRDIINIFAQVGQKDYKYPLDKRIIDTCINQYTDRKLNEIADELAVHFEPDYIKLITGRLFRSIASEIKQRKSISYQRLMELFDEVGIKKDDFELLVEYDYIIPMDEDNNIYCNYREQPAVNAIDSYNFILHKSIYTYYNKLRV